MFCLLSKYYTCLYSNKQNPKGFTCTWSVFGLLLNGMFENNNSLPVKARFINFVDKTITLASNTVKWLGLYQAKQD